MEVIRHVEVDNSLPASILINNIPQTYTDLYLLSSLRANAASTRVEIEITLNGDTSSTYTYQRIIGYDNNLKYTNPGTGVNSGTNSTGNSATANTFSNASLYMPNYTSTTTKNFHIQHAAENNSTSSWIVGLSTHSFANSTGITSIQFDTSGSSLYMQYSSITLYGITAGSDGITTVS